MRRWAAPIASVVLISCSSATSGAVTSAPAASPSSPVPTLAATTCRLPAELWDASNSYTQGGFIDVSSGRFSADPGSVMVRDAADYLYHTPGQPILYGDSDNSPPMPSISYDRAMSRWVPVPEQDMSPDGRHYAYAVSNGGSSPGIHLVDVATGTDRVVSSTASIPFYSVVAYQQEGIYLHRVGLAGPLAGLWRLDASTGAITQVSTDTPFYGVFVGYDPGPTGIPDAWWSTVSGDFSASSDSHAYFQYLTGVAGQHGETWFGPNLQGPGAGLRINVLGADLLGHAVVEAESPSAVELWLLSTPNSATRLYAGDNNGSPALAFAAAVADSTGWWIGSRTGVYLATADQFKQVSSTPAVPTGRCSQ